MPDQPNPIHEQEREEHRSAVEAMTEAEWAEFEDPQTYRDTH